MNAPPPIVVTACRCGWEFPRELFLARRRGTGADTMSSEDLAALLSREPLCIYFSCPECSCEVFADIGVKTPRVLPTG